MFALGFLGAGAGAGGGGDVPEGTPRLEPKHLFEKRRARDNARLKAYNQILNQIHTRIYHTSQLSGTTNYLVYTVPPFILGLPSLDLEDCIVYIVHMLRQSGFEVRYTYPNLLYISWKHYEREYNRQMNPIVQAMAPPASTSKKGKDGTRGTTASNQGTAPPRSVSFAPTPAMMDFGAAANRQAPPRSIHDYKPPDAFLQNVTRPAPRADGPTGPPLSAPTMTPPSTDRASSDVLAELWRFT